MPGKFVVSLTSVTALKNATKDPEFWLTPALQKPIKAAVRDEMAKLIESAAQLDCSSIATSVPPLPSAKRLVAKN